MRKDAVLPVVSKTARDEGTALRPTLFYGSAREGMRDFLTHALDPASGGVLLPGFIGLSPHEGSGVLDPVNDVGARAGFYDLGDDLSVDLDDLRRALSAERYSVIVVIHYFGRSEPRMEEIRAIADQHGASIVEDLAHGFFTANVAGRAGRVGDVALFSLHKMFPFGDGGMVQYPRTGLLTGQSSTRPDLAQRLLDYDWQAIADARRSIFLELTTRLSALPERGRDFELIWPELADGDVPQTLPVRILGDGRDGIYFGMNGDGYGMVSLYHTLIESSRGRFPALTRLSRHIINFPVHQDVRASDLDGMIASFQRQLHARTEEAAL